MNGVEDEADRGDINSDCMRVSSEAHTDNHMTETSLEDSSPLLEINQREVMEELDFEDEAEIAPRIQEITLKCPTLNLSNQVNSEEICEQTLSKIENNSVKSPENSNDANKEFSGGEVEEGEEIEEGECDGIEDGEVDTVEHLDKVSCRFFQKGRCAWGSDCRFLHLSDKGLYNMFESPAVCKNPPVFPPPPPPPLPVNFIHEPNYYYPPPVETDSRCESIWDRALNEAKERVKLSRMKKEEDSFEENKLYMTVEKGERYVDRCLYPLARESGSYTKKSPASISKTLSNNFSSRFDYNVQEKRRNQDQDVKKNNKKENYFKSRNYDSEWHDPWRRSKSPDKRKRARSKSLSDSSRSDANSESSWESAKAPFLNPSPKRHLRRNHRSETKSHPYRHRKSPSRQSRSPSCSSKWTSSSRSNSSASSSVSSKSSVKGRRSRSPSSVFSKRIYRSSERARSNKARSRSISRSPPRFKFGRKMIQPANKRRVSISPKIRFTVSPKRRINASPKRRIGVSPKRRICVSPKRRIGVSPKRRVGVSPKRRVGVSPKRRVSVSPKRRVSVSPKRRVSVSPKRRVSVSPQRRPSYDSLSSSSSSSELSKSKCVKSGRSDMSISPVSDSPLSEVSESKSDYSEKLKLNVKRNWERRVEENHQVRLKIPKTNFVQPGYAIEKVEKRPNPPPPPPPAPKKRRKIGALEMELLKYQGKTPASNSHQVSTSATDAKNSATSNTLDFETEMKIIKQPGSKGALTKRDILMRQLKAVEEAIARKKKSMIY